MRGVGAANDQAANIWFSVPAVGDQEQVPEEALIDFIYRHPVAPSEKGS
jgi:hypothetical protein